MINTSPPSGMRDFLPAELARRKHVEGVIRRVFESYGFVALETPSIENLTTLLGKYGEEGDQLLYRILHRRDKLTRALETEKPSEKDLAELGLRYDLTVPLARVIANNRDLPKFFKRYQVQPVWRADRPGKGRFREFYQCDVDIIGTNSPIADAEVCSAVAKVLLNLGFHDFHIHLNHRGLLKSLIATAGLKPEQEETALVAVDKIDKIGEEGALKELEQRGIGQTEAKRLLELLKRDPDCPNETAEIERLEKILANNPDAAKPLSELKDILAIARGNFLESHIRIDATLARGLGYYTGPIFEIRANDLKGSLGGGGRYDGLIGMFSGSNIPAVGFSIGFERLILVMEERKLFPDLQIGPEIMLCRFPEVQSGDVVRIAETMRQSDLKVEIFPETPKVGKQIAYAETVGAKVVGILGSSEISAGTITIKHLAGGEQVNLPLAEAIQKIREWLKK